MSFPLKTNAEMRNNMNETKEETTTDTRELQVMRYRYEKERKKAAIFAILFILMILAVVAAAILVIIPRHKQAVETSLSLEKDEAAIHELETELAAAVEEKNLTAGRMDAFAENVRNAGFTYDVDVRFMRKVFPDFIVTNGVDGFQFFPIDTSLPLHSYDWNFLSKKGSVTSYGENNTTLTSFGIDVSKYQGQIDWKKVKADGVKYAFIRLGFRGYGEEGTIVLDECFEDNMKGATGHGIKTGVYFFTQAVTIKEAVEEADFVLKHIKDYDISYPVVFDTESISKSARAENLGVSERTEIAKAFCDTIAEAGYTPMIYASLVWYATELDLAQLTDYKKWYAGYEAEPGFPYEFDIWQYSSKGRVDGIGTDVDVNMSFLPLP